MHLNIHDLHLLQHIHEKHYAAQTGHWIARHIAIAAILLAGLLCYALYIILSSQPINDYTPGTWGLFG